MDDSSDETAGFLCANCSTGFPLTHDHYVCSQCPGGTTLCAPCFFNVDHKHEVRLVRGVQRDHYLYRYEDPVSGNALFLGNYTSSLPGSRTIRKNSIGFVVSLMSFKNDRFANADDDVDLDDPNDVEPDTVDASGDKGDTQQGADGSGVDKGSAIDGGPDQEASPSTPWAELQGVYRDASGYRGTVDRDGVLYHHISMDDVSSRSLLPTSRRFLFEETCFFVRDALKRSNVLLHCFHGQKRSPTLFIAFMVTRGMGVEKAVSMIDAGYQGAQDWGHTYRKTRRKWLRELKRWQDQWPVRLAEYSKRLQTYADCSKKESTLAIELAAKEAITSSSDEGGDPPAEAHVQSGPVSALLEQVPDDDDDDDNDLDEVAASAAVAVGMSPVKEKRNGSAAMRGITSVLMESSHDEDDADDDGNNSIASDDGDAPVVRAGDDETGNQ